MTRGLAVVAVVVGAAGCTTPQYVVEAQAGVRRAEARLEAATDQTEAIKAAAALEQRREDLRAAGARCANSWTLPEACMGRGW